MSQHHVCDFLGNEWDIDCMGCAIRDGNMQVPGGFIQKTQFFCVHQDPLMPLPGFLVIASLRHIRSIAEISDEEYAELSQLIQATHHAIKAVTQIEFLTIVQEESSVHFHLWFFPWTRTIIEHHGPPSLTKIRAIMAEQQNQVISAAEWHELEETIQRIRSLSTLSQ